MPHPYKTKNVTQYLTGIITTTLLVVGCSSEPDGKDTATTEAKSRPVKMMDVGLSGKEALLHFPAVVQPNESSTLSFAVSGILKSISVKESQAVVKGDVLATLEKRDFEIKLESAKSQYDNAEQEYQRARELIKSDVITRSELAQKKTTRDTSAASFEQAQKALKDSTLIAPFSGSVSSVSFKKSENVQAGKPVLVLLGRGAYKVVFNLPSNIIAHAKKPSESKKIAYVVLEAEPGLKIPASFKEVSLEADQSSQTYAVTMTFLGPEHLNILPGMNADVWIEDPSKLSNDQSISVPLSAVGIKGDGRYVWVVDKVTLIVTKRDVVLEDGVGLTLKVVSGLEKGDSIVVAGISSLTDGMKVRPWSKQ